MEAQQLLPTVPLGEAEREAMLRRLSQSLQAQPTRTLAGQEAEVTLDQAEATGPAPHSSSEPRRSHAMGELEQRLERTNMALKELEGLFLPTGT